ncbi:hypothetical protein GCM10009663_01610 [Kitasatospora arboriphila]|uniref:Uncharacterized protein n=1 Tax=Kitasatospora arboriphila TaxID=258052 RepID=A0ABP4DV84_9ACTN
MLREAEAQVASSSCHIPGRLAPYVPRAKVRRAGTNQELHSSRAERARAPREFLRDRASVGSGGAVRTGPRAAA